MNVLVDSDVFCKLALANLLEPALEILGYNLRACRLLPALTHMLKRGRLVEAYGPKCCAKLESIARVVSTLTAPQSKWLDCLAPLPEIDPGEAQLFAKAADDGLTVMTGDKKAVQALKTVPDLAAALCGRVVVLEAILSSLCLYLGVNEVRRSIVPLMNHDIMLRVCFSKVNPSPTTALASYFSDLSDSARPLVLWKGDRAIASELRT